MFADQNAVTHIMVKQRQLLCKNAKQGVYCEENVWKIQNSGCDNKRRHGSAYCGSNCKFK